MKTSKATRWQLVWYQVVEAHLHCIGARLPLGSPLLPVTVVLMQEINQCLARERTTPTAAQHYRTELQRSLANSLGIDLRIEVSGFGGKSQPSEEHEPYAFLKSRV